MSPENPCSFIPELDRERLERVPGWEKTILGRLMHGLFYQLTTIEEYRNLLEEKSDLFEKLVKRTEKINPGVVQWWYGFVQNLDYAPKDVQDDVISATWDVTPDGKNLYAPFFGSWREVTIDNVRKYHPEAFDPLEAAILEWAERIILEKPGTQVLYAMTSPENDEIRFLNALTRSSQNPKQVDSTSYRIGKLNAKDAQNLLSYLAQDKEGRELVTQEITDESDQKQTITLLIINNEETFIKGNEEIKTAVEATQQTIVLERFESLPIFLWDRDLIQPNLPSYSPFWLRTELPLSKKEEHELVSDFHYPPLQASHDRAETEKILPILIRPSRKFSTTHTRASEKEIAHFLTADDFHLETPTRIEQTPEENVHKPIEILSNNQESTRTRIVPQVRKAIPLVIPLQAEIRAFSYVEDDLRQEIQLPQEDYLPLLEISQTEMSQQKFLNEPQSITPQTESQSQEKGLVLKESQEETLEAERQPAVFQATFAQKENQSTKPTLILQEQQTAKYQDQMQENHLPRQLFFEVEQPLSELKIIQVEEVEEQKVEDFIIHPKEDSLPKARKIIEAISQPQEELNLPFWSPDSFKRVPKRRVRSIISGWQILPFRRKCEVPRVTNSLTLSAFMRRIIIISSFRRRDANRYEQREGKLLSGIYVTNQKSDSIPQSQVIFDSRWLPKVIYEAKDPLPGADVIVPIKRKVIKADEYQEVVTIDDLTYEELIELEEAFWATHPKNFKTNLKFLFLPLSN